MVQLTELVDYDRDFNQTAVSTKPPEKLNLQQETSDRTDRSGDFGLLNLWRRVFCSSLSVRPCWFSAYLWLLR